MSTNFHCDGTGGRHWLSPRFLYTKYGILVKNAYVNQYQYYCDGTGEPLLPISQIPSYFNLNTLCKHVDKSGLNFIMPGKNNTVSFSLDLNNDTPETIKYELVSELGFSEEEAHHIACNIKYEIEMIEGVIPNKGQVSFETLPISSTTTQVKSIKSATGITRAVCIKIELMVKK